MVEKFPLINLKGTPKEIGYNHGKLLEERIQLTVKWYKDIIQVDDTKLLELASHFKSKIFEFNPKYCEEIDAIAEGANIDPLWIYMLNARSEIMNMYRNECTASYFKNTALLGQNWDWAEELEELAILMTIETENKPKILMMTEPGIIGKIGFNSFGLGVSLNFLESNQESYGVPIHIILRAILESSTIEEATSIIEPFKDGKAANIIIGNQKGNFIDIEFAGDRIYHITKSITESDVFIHTNHYLSEKINDPNDEKFASSYARYKKAIEITTNNHLETIEDMKTIFLDQTDKELPICRPYVENPDIGNVGTICTLIMDLPNLVLYITKGNPFENKFDAVRLYDQ
ncbi:MAG: C45 family autoproteolytic acyltransferase/hydrolase [Candidatus Hodarchaeales archaeon]|jgi:isopenicillin-N N-acyltransferase-like protein